MKQFILILSFLLGFSGTANAITWSETKVPDPFSDKKCNVSEIVSSGSYIYNYPSKWDGVYFPATDQNWLWACPSGFVAFGWDEFFNEEDSEDPIDENERANIAALLENSSPVGSDWETRWQRYLEIEAVRARSDVEREFTYRLRAYFADNEEQAGEYRNQSAELIVVALADPEISGAAIIERQFLLGVYAERKGETEKADDWFRRARETKWTDEEDGTEHQGLPYFSELIDEAVETRGNASRPWGDDSK